MRFLPGVIVWVLTATDVFGKHFRGGTFDWVPIGNTNKVKVTYRFSFNGFTNDLDGKPSAHDTCTEPAYQYGYKLDTKGWLTCDGCAQPWDNQDSCLGCISYDKYNLYNPDVIWQCTDYSEEGNWDIGKWTFNVTVPTTTNRMSIFYETCCWVELQNAYPQANQGWRMSTEIDLNNIRSNGLPNSSPRTSPMPVVLFHKGCDYWLEIPVDEPDGDNYRCRNTDRYEKECYDDGRGSKGRVCGELDYVHVYPNCTLHFDTHGEPGNYAVRVMIEDLDENDNPRSKISLSFLLEVSPDESTCRTPTIVNPSSKTCHTIPVGGSHSITVVAEAATESLPISRIETIKPFGMTSEPLADVEGHPLQKSVTLTWTPHSSQTGQHLIGMNAVDSAGFPSGWTYFTLNVVDAPPLSASPTDSYPPHGDQVDAPKEWIIAYNRPIQRPSQPAFISLISQEHGRIVGQVDTSNSAEVEFRNQEIFIPFITIDDYPGLHTYTLAVDEGAVIDAQYGDDGCPFTSAGASWDVTIEGEGGVLPTEESRPNVVECKPGSIDIPTPEGAKEGEECFIHATDSAATVSSEGSVSIPYRVCCGTTCSSTAKADSIPRNYITIPSGP